MAQYLCADLEGAGLGIQHGLPHVELAGKILAARIRVQGFASVDVALGLGESLGIDRNRQEVLR